jgi:hypothetical protein
MYVKVAKNLKGREKAKVKHLRMRMMVTDDLQVIYKKRNKVNGVYVLKVVYVLKNLLKHHIGIRSVISFL